MISAKKIFSQIGKAIGLTVRFLTIPCRARRDWIRRPALVVYATPLFAMFLTICLLIAIIEAFQDFGRDVREVWRSWQ